MQSDCSNSAQIADTERQLLDYLFDLFVKNKPPETCMLPECIQEDARFQDICAQLLDMRALSYSLRIGDMEQAISSRGYIISNMKTVQSNMRHLAYQAKKITEGEYAQKVEFLGEFSESFSEMTQRLLDTTAQLVNLANVDSLTKIANRMALTRFLTFSFEESVKNQTEFCVLMLDIDHFKDVNDTYGHSVGDQVLAEVARRIQSQTRQVDFVARYGGEEFVVVLPDTGAAIAQKVCERILSKVGGTPILSMEGNSISVTISIGFSQRHADDAEATQVLSRSDIALYDAKRLGRNRCCMFRQEASM